MARNAAETSWTRPELSPRQAAVLQAMVTAYVGEAAPIGSATLAHLLPENLSSASVRNVLAELTRLGLVEKPHASAGRVPTERGMRLFVDALLDHPAQLVPYEQRNIDFSVEEAGAEELVSVASQLLSERTRQLGFVVSPRLERVVLRHVSLVRISSESVLAVLVAQTGATYRRVIRDAEPDQRELDRVAALLNPRVEGRTLGEVRRALELEAEALRHKADRIAARVLELGSRMFVSEAPGPSELVIETRLALLDQPEFQDPRRVRDLFEAIETKQRLLEVLDGMIEGTGVCVAFGEETDEPSLRGCALVAKVYGAESIPLGVLGVIGPMRMDFSRVIPLVDYLSHAVTEKLDA